MESDMLQEGLSRSGEIATKLTKLGSSDIPTTQETLSGQP
jgi:hypothetical protein